MPRSGRLLNFGPRSRAAVSALNIQKGAPHGRLAEQTSGPHHRPPRRRGADWPCLGGPARSVVVFGDSLSDPGNAFVILHKVAVPPFSSLIPDAPYARGGLHFSNGADLGRAA